MHSGKRKMQRYMPSGLLPSRDSVAASLVGANGRIRKLAGQKVEVDEN